MTIAITPFDGFCGFRPLKEISHFLENVPSLRNLISDKAAKEFTTIVEGRETSDNTDDMQTNKKALQTAFSALMTKDKSTVAAAAKELVASAEKQGEEFAGGGGPSNGGKELANLVVRLNGQFEGDIGLFVLFFLNYVKLEVGEAMFLKADDIHAYLSGGTHYLLQFRFRKVLTDGLRHHRVHGLIRQRRPSWLHTQISRYPHVDIHAHLLLRSNIGAKDEPRRLSLRHFESNCLLFVFVRYPL